MTPIEIAAAIAAAAVGSLVALVAAGLRVRRASARLVRVNVSGRRVPAVLGEALVLGGLAGLAVAAAAAWLPFAGARLGRVGAAVAVSLVGMFLAGRYDDLKGDEGSRGFAGHAAAARSGALTGGVVKLLAGGAVGFVCAVLVHGTVPRAFTTAVLVALGANFLNLLDRAPGRAAKVGVALALAPIALGRPEYVLAAAGTVAALATILPFDLTERGMLGDAGANPLGAVLGLGLGLLLPLPAALVAVGVLGLLNAASERWSFSEVIARSRPLSALDRLGRRSQ